MFQAEEVRARFIQEVDRLLSVGASTNLFQMEKDCHLKQGDLWRLYEKKILDIRAIVIVQFVTTYRAFDVSYEYIYEGKRPQQLQQDVREELKKELCAHLHKF